MKLSIVTTLYRSENCLSEFYARITATAQEISDQYEIIFVNDGSPDDSLGSALRLQQRDSKIRVVDLSRNFGHHHAIMAGLSQSCGEKVFLIDVDLEEHPEWLLDFYREAEESCADVVYGVQEMRKGGFLNKRFVGLFYKLFNLLSETKIPSNPCTVRLMTRGYVDALLKLKDRNLFLAGNFAWAGYRQKGISVKKQQRERRSSYSLIKMIQLFLNAVSGFSSYPLKLIFFVGVFISGISGVIGGQMLVAKLINPSVVQLGFPSLIISIWFLGGLTLFSIGLVGLYLSKVFNEVKHRPTYLIRKIYSGDRDE